MSTRGMWCSRRMCAICGLLWTHIDVERGDGELMHGAGLLQAGPRGLIPYNG